MPRGTVQHVSRTHAPLDRFVRALHRRQVALRAVEGAGAGLVAGCGAALVLLPVLLWRGGDAWGVAAVALGLGALGGAMRGIARRPTTLAAAAEADRQLGTADLLATAWAVRGRAGNRDNDQDAWCQTVLALATARCGGVSPSQVLLHRLGVRAWGAISLAVGLVATLASLSSDTLRAGPTAAGLSADARPARRPEAARPILDMTAADSMPQRRREQNRGERQDAGGETPGAETPDAAEADERPPGERRTAAGLTAGSGSGRAAGKTRPEAPVSPDIYQTLPPDRAPDRAVGTGKSAGGTGRSRRNPGGDAADVGGTVGGPDLDPAGVPWQQESWAAARRAAGEAIRAGKVPDDHRDLVRGYFDRVTTSYGDRADP